MLPPRGSGWVSMYGDGSGGLYGYAFHGLRILQKQLCFEIRREDVSRNADGNRPAVVSESFFDITDGIGDQKPHSISFGFARSEAHVRGHIPGFGGFPFVLGVRLAPHHPIIKSFESNAARGGVTKQHRTFSLAAVKYGAVGFEWSFAVGNDEKRGAVAVEPSYLQIAGVFADVRIVKRTNCVGLFK